MAFDKPLRASLLCLAFFLPIPEAHALFRAYVAPTGSDANPCTLAAPCRLLPAALATVDDGGEIWMLDSANYNTGTVTVAKSVTILAVPGAVGSVVTNGADALAIAPSASRVTLRNLVITSVAGTAPAIGVNMDSVNLTVDGCQISGVTSGIAMTGVGGRLRVLDSVIRDVVAFGIVAGGNQVVNVYRTVISRADAAIRVSASGAVSSAVAVSHSSLMESTTGLSVIAAGGATVNAAIDNSQVASNTNGLRANATASTVVLVAQGNQIANNGIGVVTQGGTIVARGNSITGNGTGMFNQSGILQSAGDNLVSGNSVPTSGTITTTSPLL